MIGVVSTRLVNKIPPSLRRGVRCCNAARLFRRTNRLAEILDPGAEFLARERRQELSNPVYRNPEKVSQGSDTQESLRASKIRFRTSTSNRSHEGGRGRKGFHPRRKDPIRITKRTPLCRATKIRNTHYFFIHNALLFNHASFCTCIKAFFCRKKE